MDADERKIYQELCDILKFNLSFAMRRTVNLLSESPKDPPNIQNPHVQIFYEFLDPHSQIFKNKVTNYCNYLVGNFEKTEEFDKILKEGKFTKNDGEIFILFKSPKKIVDPSYLFLKHFGFRFNRTYYNFDKELLLLFKIEFLFFACTHENFSAEWINQHYQILKTEVDDFIKLSENKESLANSRSYISIILPTIIVLIGEDLVRFLIYFYDTLWSFGKTTKNTLVQHYQNGYEKKHGSTLFDIVSEFLHLVLIELPFNIIYSVTGLPLRIAQALVELFIKENDATRNSLINILSKTNIAITTAINILIKLGVRLALYLPRKLIAFAAAWIIYPIVMAPATLLIKPLINKIHSMLYPQRVSRESKISPQEVQRIGSMLIKLNLAIKETALNNPGHKKIFFNDQNITLSEIYTAAQTFTTKGILLPLPWLDELKNHNNLVFLFQTETNANPIKHIFIGTNSMDELLPKLVKNENNDSLILDWRLSGEVIYPAHFEEIVNHLSNRYIPLNKLFLIRRNIDNPSLGKISKALIANDRLNPETFSVPINPMSKIELETLLNLVQQKKSIKYIPLLVNSKIDHLNKEIQDLRHEISRILDERKGITSKPAPVIATQANETRLHHQFNRVLNLFAPIAYSSSSWQTNSRQRGNTPPR